MVARFLAAGLVTAAVAAGLAGSDMAAQAPPAQNPPAAAAAKPAKPPQTWPPDADSLRKRRLKAEALPLFADLDPVEITLTADFKAVQRDRDVKSRKLHPGTLTIAQNGASSTPIPIQLRARGHVRRNPRVCEFAPLRIEFQKGSVEGTVFSGLNFIRLGTHCQSERVYQQYTLKEYLANRLHAALTPRAVRARLARVTYADTAPGNTPFTKLGIFFEDPDDLAKRVEMRELMVPRQPFAALDQTSLLFMSLFQYMIGNTDYSIMVLHNIIMLDDVAGARHTVPFDFDYSGLVDAHYAVPAKGLGLASVVDRMYRGPCRTEAEVQRALGPFREKQAELLALPASLVPLGLDDGHRRSAEKYLNEFFDLIGKPDKVKKVFVTDCRPLDGM